MSELVVINRDNFFQNTKAIWTVIMDRLPLFEKNPDYISYVTQKTFIIFSDRAKYVESDNYLSQKESSKKYKILSKRVLKSRIKYYVEEVIEAPKPSSFYWFTEDGVYRKSDHWGNVGDCYWKISNHSKEAIIGFCKWSEFQFWR